MPRRNFVSRVIVPAVGLCGLFYASYFTLAQANAPEAPPQQLNLPPSSAYAKAISGSGLIEANTRNIAVGSPVAALVQAVLVTEGDRVAAGAPLFQLDDRTAKAEVEVRQAELAAAKAQLAEAKALRADQQDQLQRARNLTRGVSVTTDRIERLQFALSQAEARVGTAEAAIATAQSRLQATEVALARLTVTAPVAGRILKTNIKPGVFVEANASQSPVVMGNDQPLHVRVSIDENDLWRLKPEQEATGALRSNRDIGFPLKFVRLEPYVIPKRSLTGSNSERVDTRIIEAIYEVTALPTLPLYIGQQVDVFIKAE